MTVVNKDYQQINSYDKDVDLLGRVILLLASTYFLNTVNMHSRIYGWQMLHMNNNALDDSGHAPTFYACNQYSTKYQISLASHNLAKKIRHIFIQFHTNGSPPSVFMKQNLCPTTKVEEAENELHGFKRFGYEKIYGTSFMRKIDFILSIFSS